MTTDSRYASLTRDQLATLVPELLLIGQLIDRSGMAWCISAFGREEMAQVAVEEWASSSPVYTRRMQQALGYAPSTPGGGDVVTIFKGLQLDIGAPPQFMDFRYTVHDPWHGEFHLDHCGALMDVEPMGPDYVRSMCHDIEDPTFDATAVASNPRAQVRPIHRPPRASADRAADRRPHCAWTVIIDESYPEVAPIPALSVVAASRAATPPAGADRPGRRGAGRLRRSARLRPGLHGVLAVRPGAHRRRGVPPDAPPQPGLPDRRARPRDLAGAGHRHRHQAAGRDRRRRGRADPPRPRHATSLDTLRLHPLLNPAAYVDASFSSSAVSVSGGPADEDGGWITLCGPGSVRPLQAAVRAVDPHLDVEVTGTDTAWTATVVRRAEPAPDFDEVAVTRISTGATFAFEPRRSLPITPV